MPLDFAFPAPGAAREGRIARTGRPFVDLDRDHAAAATSCAPPSTGCRRSSFVSGRRSRRSRSHGQPTAARASRRRRPPAPLPSPLRCCGPAGSQPGDEVIVPAHTLHRPGPRPSSMPAPSRCCATSTRAPGSSTPSARPPSSARARSRSCPSTVTASGVRHGAAPRLAARASVAVFEDAGPGARGRDGQAARRRARRRARSRSTRQESRSAWRRRGDLDRRYDRRAGPGLQHLGQARQGRPRHARRNERLAGCRRRCCG